MSDWSSDVCSSDLDWTPARSRRDLVHPDFGAVEAWNDAVHDTASGIVTYETHYRVASTGKPLAARSQIRFTPKEELEALLSRSEEPHVGKDCVSTCSSRWSPVHYKKNKNLT